LLWGEFVKINPLELYQLAGDQAPVQEISQLSLPAAVIEQMLLIFIALSGFSFEATA